MTDSTLRPHAGGTGPEISLVIPVFNEEGSLKILYGACCAQLEKTGKSFEVLFIDDGSSDRSPEIMREIQREDRRVVVIRFRRNFGKSAALSAGFAASRGGLVFTMDADLQDDPAEIPAFLDKLAEGFDLVSGWKHKRQDPLLAKKVPSRIFNLVTSLISGVRIHDFNCGFKLYRAEVVKGLRIYGELYRYLPALAHWKGYRVAEIKVRHHQRRFGRSKFGGSRLVKGFLDLITVLFLNRYVRRPLHLFGTLGSLFCLAGFSIGCYFVYYWMIHQNIGGRVPLLLFAVFLMLSGIQLISTGLIGEMLAGSRGYLAEPGYQVAEVLDSSAETSRGNGQEHT
ncbi:MAG: glycosyltransferase family 2 protein [Candidatus Glassbacteria bacterium]|nr:glycosyltransferase family 2 protein [Candidatus Glassbacteria bacterium]